MYLIQLYLRQFIKKQCSNIVSCLFEILSLLNVGNVVQLYRSRTEITMKDCFPLIVRIVASSY